MKKVFSSASDVIHVYAQREQIEGKSSNVFFEYDRIYSYGYHYLLGEFITNKKGDTAIMINNQGYSNTTAKHIGWITSGTRQYKQFFTMYCDTTNVLRQLNSLKSSLIRAKKPEKYISEANYLFDRLNEYLNWKGEKNYQQNKDLKEIKKLMLVFQSDNKDYLEKLREYQANKDKREKNAKIKKAKNDLQKFFNYEVYRVSGLNEDYLRVSQCGKYIETTQDLRVDIKQAAILYKLIQSGKDIKGYQIDNFTVISLNGVLKIGCHNINVKNMHEVGKKIINL
jgi:hypothetical protein